MAIAASQFVSTDGGASFAARPGYGPLGIIGAVAGSGKGAYDPAADTVFGIWSTGEFQRMPIANPQVTPTVTAALGPFAGGSNDEAAVSYVGTGATQTQVAVIAGRTISPEIRFKHHTNPTDPNVAANWLGGDFPIAAGQHVALATGPAGIVLAVGPRDAGEHPGAALRERDEDVQRRRADQLRRAGRGLHPRRRPPPVRNRAPARPVAGPVRRRVRAGRALCDVARRRHLVGAAEHRRRREPVRRPRRGHGGRQQGLARLRERRHLRQHDPRRDARPAPAAAPASASAAAAACRRPRPAPPPASYAGANRNVTVSDRNASYRFSVPKSCVAPGQAFTTTLRWAKRKRKGNLFVKVARVDFYLGSKRLTIDRKAPFVKRYRIVATQVRGSVINIRARAFIKVRRGRAPTKSLRAAIRVCR